MLIGLGVAGAFSILFISGQLSAWQELNSKGLYASSNPAVAFFYVFKFAQEIFGNMKFSLISVLLLSSIYFYNFTTPEKFFNNPESDRTKLFLSQILHQ